MKDERNRGVSDEASTEQRDFSSLTATATPTTCPRCGAAFECASQTGAARCWCAELPLIEPVSDEPACFCPTCLGEIIAARERERAQ